MFNMGYVRIISVMLQRDLLGIRKSFWGNLINVFSWVIITVGIKMYVLPYFGVSNTYGSFVLIGAIASVANMDIMHRMMMFANDITTERQDINYDLLLPIPSKLVFVERALFLSIAGFVVSMLVLPVGKLLFWNHINLGSVSWFKFIPILILTNVFLSYFAVYLASKISGLHAIVKLWMRVIFPLWFLGGFEFSWYALKDMAPNFAYLDLCNPYIYATEGLRSAVFGPAEYIPFWISFCVLVLFTLFIGWRALVNLTRKLDAV
ncbi:ABC transporter permease [bacterium]|jgi:hypothetical protein|nr:ABC transporter permease [bacterium]MBT5015571.1 ABC transporter permease [bacterium]